jgi:hypothetical protein
VSTVIEAAWITVGGGAFAAVVGVTGAVIGARIALRSARQTTDAAIRSASQDVRAQIEAGSEDIRAQLEAERDRRLWEKRAEAYADAIATVMHRTRCRGFKMVEVMTGEKNELPGEVASWAEVEARVLAYASEEVFSALRAAGDTDRGFYTAVRLWETYSKQAADMAKAGQPLHLPGDEPMSSRRAVDRALGEASNRTDEFIALARRKLQGDSLK